MPALFQSERINASKKCFNLHKAQICAILHSESMDDFDSCDENAGNNLQGWREYRGMTQEELAEKVGTYSGQISLLENGKRQLSVKWLHRLADALQITPGWLLDHHPDDLDPDIYDIWGKIPTEQKLVARDVLVAFKHFPKDGTKG
jgi:transcriptional regulator with XRE-family HTH domain